MSKERDIQILQYKIADMDRKIALYSEYDISDKKIDNLRILKLKYETQLEEIENS
jgi:hypothetical protein